MQALKKKYACKGGSEAAELGPAPVAAYLLFMYPKRVEKRWCRRKRNLDPSQQSGLYINTGTGGVNTEGMFTLGKARDKAHGRAVGEHSEASTVATDWQAGEQPPRLALSPPPAHPYTHTQLSISGVWFSMVTTISVLSEDRIQICFNDQFFK